MDKDYLILKRASASRSSGEWGDDDFDVLAEPNRTVTKSAGRHSKQGQQFALMTPKGREDRTPTHGHEPTREAAMAAFAKSWRREWARPGHWRAMGQAGNPPFARRHHADTKEHDRFEKG